jgi:hypothetical protein
MLAHVLDEVLLKNVYFFIPLLHAKLLLTQGEAFIPSRAYQVILFPVVAVN